MEDIVTFNTKKFLKAFTLMEVMVAIFVFSSGMLGYMAYHARVNSIMFENESAQIAHGLALNLAEEINSMTPERFHDLSEGISLDSHNFDSFIHQYIDSLRDDGGNPVNVGPFDSRGKPGSDGLNYSFYRYIKISTYDTETGSFNPDPSLFGKMRNVDVVVAWPYRGHGSEKCNTINKFDKCNYLTVSVVKMIQY
jgi:prepilin-type N-terminal cleavage/methylation domain-containing protein